jgi:hypothetical protein
MLSSVVSTYGVIDGDELAPPQVLCEKMEGVSSRGVLFDVPLLLG